VTAILGGGTGGGTIENVKVYGSIVGGQYNAGGITATITGTGSKISNCANYAKVSSSNNVGGIAGAGDSSMTDVRIEYCANYGEIIQTRSGSYFAGGIIGNSYLGSVSHSDIVISNCYNAGAVSMPNHTVNTNQMCGGLLGKVLGVGYYNSLRMENCFNYGDVTIGDADAPNGPVIMGRHNTAPLSDDLLTPALSNDFYLSGSGAMLFGTGDGSVPNDGVDGEDGWGSDAIKALVFGMDSEQFADGTVLARLNDGPGGTAEGAAKWGQGREYPELIDFFVKLTPGSAARTSAGEAGVTFTSGEAGAYYYAVVPSGAAVPDIDTTGEGSPLAAGENAITLTGLESGAHDIHIVAKDTAGSVGYATRINMTIPSYPDPDQVDDSPLDVDTSGEDAPAVVVRPPSDSVTVEAGVETVEVPENTLRDAVSQAIEAAAGGGTEPTIKIVVEAPAGAVVNKVDVNIRVSDLEEAAGEDVSVKVASAVGEVTLSAEAIDELLAEAGEAEAVDVVIGRIAADETLEEIEEGLTESQKDSLRAVYDISFVANGTELDFVTDGKRLTIGLPYTLDTIAGELPEGVGVLYIPDDGSPPDPMEVMRYDEDRALVIFKTDHLSAYAVTYEPPAENTPPSSSGGGCDAGPAGFTLMALAMFAASAAGRRK
jgi:hypothetical protein